MGTLDESTRRALVLAASSDTGDLATLARAAAQLGLDLSVLAPAEGSGLVTFGAGTEEFRHPLARSAIYADAPAGQRRDAHRALAAALPDRDGDRRAWHLAAAATGPDEPASAALEQAGARGRDRSAYATAAAAYVQAGRLAADPERRARLLWEAAEAAWLGGLADRAVALLDEARDQATTDRWAIAEATYEEAIGLARESGQQSELTFGLAGLAWLQARRGREQECRRCAAEALRLAAELGIRLYEIWAIAALGELELGLGDAAQAAGHFERLQRLLTSLGITDVNLSPGADLADAYLRLGRHGEAQRVAAQFAAAAGAKGQPWSLARAFRCRGLLAADGGFAEAFEQAMVQHAMTPDSFEAARTRLAYGERLRRSRNRVLAREQLRTAAEVFERLDAQPWASRARAELAATGETRRPRDASTLEELTPQELQIAVLLTGGRTTREAAAALFLSPKTVEYHLRHIYQKLGIHSREELARMLTASDTEPGGQDQPGTEPGGRDQPDTEPGGRDQPGTGPGGPAEHGTVRFRRDE